jgi:hypothetical protein
MFELSHIQRAFMRHFGAKLAEHLRVPDGDYIVPVFDEEFNVRVKDNVVSLIFKDFDQSNATRIGGGDGTHHG